MMQTKRRFMLISFMSILCAKTFAHDFALKNSDGVTIYYSFNFDRNEVKVTFRTYYGDRLKNCYSGSVVIPDSVTYERRTYPVTSISNYAFEECSNLTSITIPNSVTSIGDNTFNGCSGLTSVTVGDSVESIGDYAFDGCSSMTSVNIPNSVISIGKFAFISCDGLTDVNIPNSVTSIGSDAFEWCSGLTSLTIGSSVESIELQTFQGCVSLRSLTIGSSVASICKYAFTYCEKLEDVYCYAENVPSTDADAFKDSHIERVTLHVPESSVEAYKTTSPWRNFKEIIAIPNYMLTYMLDGEVYKTYKYEENREIPVEPEPTKEGYIFSGWSEIPETMPDHDVEVTGTFTVIKYNLTYIVDGEEYKTVEIEYGAEITPEAGPEKEGYTFTGWNEIPETMPAHDVTVTGSFEKIILGKCATPTISFKDGKFKFESEDEGVEFKWSFNIVNNSGKGSEAGTPTKFIVSVYATKDNYEDSETATMEMDMRSPIGDVNGDGKVDAADIAKLVEIILGM